MNFATDVRGGDLGSSRVYPDPAKSVGPFAGFCTATGGTVVGPDGKPVPPKMPDGKPSPAGTTCSGGSVNVTTATNTTRGISAR